MNEQLTSYYQEIYETFKDLFYSELNRNLNIDFLKVYTNLLSTYQLKKLDQSIVDSIQQWFKNIYELNYIQELLKLNFEEIIFHNESHYTVKFNKIDHIQLNLLNKNEFCKSLEIFALKEGQNWNTSNPFCSFEYKKDGKHFRITLIHQDLSPTKDPRIFIRQLNDNNKSIDYFSNDTICLQTLKELVEQKSNIVIAGSTGSGKTTLLNSLLKLTDKSEHLIIMEDTHEIKIDRPNVSYLIANEAFGKHNLENYCAYSMRMSPDRIVLGEMRSREVVPFLLSMNSGHKGLLTTIHSNSAIDCLSRLMLLFGIYAGDVGLNSDYIMELICKNIDYIIFVENKNIKEIIKVIGSDQKVPYVESIYLKAS